MQGVVKFNKNLDAALFFIFIFEFLRRYSETEPLLLSVLGLFGMIFVVLSLFDFKFKKREFFRLICFLIVVVFAFWHFIQTGINGREKGDLVVNDGMIMTEFAAKSLVGGKNPYELNYIEAVQKEKKLAGFFDYEREELGHMQYSPFVFLLTVPAFLFSQELFGFFDLRLLLVPLFLLSAFCGYFLCGKKILFLIIFLFNSVFLVSLYKGSVDTLVLFLLILGLLFLKFKRINYASLMIALAVGTKLIAVPFVPIFFAYLFILKRKNLKNILPQIAIFCVVCGIIYLPFAIWNLKELWTDLVVYQLIGGQSGKPIAGFAGLPQLIKSVGLVVGDSKFPFFVLFMPTYLLFLHAFWKFAKGMSNLNFYIASYFFSFLIFLSFSRVIQTDYLAYISQFLVLAAFAGDKKLI